MLNEEMLTRYVNDTVAEQLVRNHEDQILMLMKYRQQVYPNQQNDREWLECSDYVLNRRKRHEFK